MVRIRDRAGARARERPGRGQIFKRSTRGEGFEHAVQIDARGARGRRGAPLSPEGDDDVRELRARRLRPLLQLPDLLRLGHVQPRGRARGVVRRAGPRARFPFLPAVLRAQPLAPALVLGVLLGRGQPGLLGRVRAIVRPASLGNRHLELARVHRVALVRAAHRRERGARAPLSGSARRMRALMESRGSAGACAPSGALARSRRVGRVFANASESRAATLA